MRTTRLIQLLALASTTVMVAMAHAGDLCNSSCSSLNISYPAGGAIEATQAVTITFGNGGFVNDGNATTGYSSGQTLVISAGNSLDFTAGGELDIGDAGNIDYTGITLDGGSFDVTSSGLSSQAIALYDVTLSGDAALILNSNTWLDTPYTLTIDGGGSTPSITVLNGTLTILGTIDILGGSLALDTDDSDSSVCELTASSSTITIGNSGTGSVDTCASSGLVLSGGSLAAGSVTLDSSDIVISGSTVTIDTGSTVISGGGITIGTLTQEDLASLEGVSLSTTDGASCTVTNGECVGSDGAKYVVNDDGELVLVKADDDGVLSAGWMALLLLLPLLRLRKIDRLSPRDQV